MSFWDDITIFWDENVLGFLTEKEKPNLDQSEVCLLNFYWSKNIVLSSLRPWTKIPEDMNKFLIYIAFLLGCNPEIPKFSIAIFCFRGRSQTTFTRFGFF